MVHSPNIYELHVHALSFRKTKQKKTTTKTHKQTNKKRLSGNKNVCILVVRYEMTLNFSITDQWIRSTLENAKF